MGAERTVSEGRQEPRYFRIAKFRLLERKENKALLWSINNDHIVLNCRCRHVRIIALQELIDMLGENVALDMVERSARCSTCGFKLISNVQIIYVRAREYALPPISKRHQNFV